MYYPYGGFYFDSTYILIIIGVIITMIASSKMNSTFRRYQRVRCHCGLTGSQAAERILRQAGIFDVTVERVGGDLTDHYDPKNKVLRLSDSTYGSDSIAAIGVAAHECGHAIQHQQSYVPLTIRGALVPVVNLGSGLSWVFIIGGIFLGMNQTLINVGIILFSLAVVFQLVTLPVEFNASSRALKILGNTGIMYGEEVDQTRKVLSAAALTYVASAAAAILSLLRLILLFGGRDRD
ncbi:MAG: zinc metallopeptidase [Anaerostipes sp.]|uniref:zinc metallopeptidase n=1 Tax=Anaerostipes sp. TaxID=1872530 RepID=UPI0039946929